MANIGYIRVSAGDQSFTLQKDVLKTYNLDKVFQDRISGRKFECLELDALIESIHSGDTLYIYRLDRLGKSLRNMLRHVSDWTPREGGWPLFLTTSTHSRHRPVCHEHIQNDSQVQM